MASKLFYSPPLSWGGGGHGAVLYTKANTLVTTVPGSDERKLHKSISVAADCIVYDLEDSVAASKKGTARQMIMDALEASEHGKAEKAVRINAVGSGKSAFERLYCGYYHSMNAFFTRIGLELDDLNVVVGDFCPAYIAQGFIEGLIPL